MYNKLRVHRLQSVNQASDKEPSHVHREFSLASDVIAEISTKKEVHDEVEIHVVLEGVVHIHDELALNHAQQLEFIHDGGYTFLGDNSRFRHLFHGEFCVFVFLRLHAPHFPETSSAQSVNLSEV